MSSNGLKCTNFHLSTVLSQTLFFQIYTKNYKSGLAGWNAPIFELSTLPSIAYIQLIGSFLIFNHFDNFHSQYFF